MMEEIVDIILEIRERVTCFDQSKAEYVMMTRGLMNEGCKFHEHLFSEEDIDDFLDRYLDTQNELMIHLIGFMDLIEQLDVELRNQIGGDDL